MHFVNASLRGSPRSHSLHFVKPQIGPARRFKRAVASGVLTRATEDRHEHVTRSTDGVDPSVDAAPARVVQVDSLVGAAKEAPKDAPTHRLRPGMEQALALHIPGIA